MRKKVKLKKNCIMGTLCACILTSLIVFSGCPGAPGTVHIVMLYLFSSFTDNVYTFDLETNTCSTSPVFKYGTDTGDNVYFYNDKGYIAAASFSTPQLITFDPNESPPTPSVFSHTWAGGPSAIVFINETKAYVTDSGTYSVGPDNNGGVFTFNPSDTGVSLNQIENSDANCQGMVYIASKNKIYVANSGLDTVSVIDTSYDTELKEIPVNTNPTAIVALSDGSKVYVFCTDYVEDSTLVEIDTITDTVNGDFSAFIAVGAGQYAVAINGTKIYYTGFSGPFYIDVSEETPTETEITVSKTGGWRSLIYNGKLYITQPDFTEGQSTLTVIDLSDNSEIIGSPFNVGVEGDAITGMALY